MYCNKFFRTEEEAKAFKKSHGGALYKNISTETDTYPFCVAWNGKPLSAGKEI